MSGRIAYLILSILFLLCFDSYEAKSHFSLFDKEVSNFIRNNFQSQPPDEFIETIMKINITEKDSKDLINNLKNIVERYVYLDILKNPPQPKENYHNIVDLIEELENVNTEERPLYDFVRDVNLIISKCQDQHFTLHCNRKISNDFSLMEMFFVSPIHYKITKNSVYSELSKYSPFFGEDIQKKIKEKEDIEIDKINGLNPIEYIQKINKGFQQYKSPQAQFVSNSLVMEEFCVTFYPLEKEDLINIKILYKGGSELKYNYTMGYANKSNKLFLDYYIKYFNHRPESFIEIFEMAKSFMIKNNILSKELNQGIIWYKEIYNNNRQFFKCRVDSNKGINVIHQNTFVFEDQTKAVNDMVECFKQFYTNDYPIVIIEDKNGGGSTYICDNLIALVNLNKQLTEFSSYRYNDDVKKIIGSSQSYKTLDTCEVKKGDYFFNKYEIDDYDVDQHGQKIKHNRTELFSATWTSRSYIESIKNNNLKTKIRKPHEIIIFTDGYSFSATSNFIKTTFLAGGAIIVGYGGNPNFEIFDSSQNPASVIGTNELKNTDALSKKIEDLGFTLRFTYKEYFDINYQGKPQIPLEFQIHEIDERFEFYQKYSDDFYNDFLEHSKYIFNKYKTECNPKNKRLLFITDECVFEDKMMHGGYECGDDGKWTKKCIPSYCDNGYDYDKKTNKCLENICLVKEIEQMEKENTALNLFISSMVFFGLFVITLIIYIILFCKKFEKKNYFFFLIIPFLIVGIVLIMVSTLKYDLSL